MSYYKVLKPIYSPTGQATDTPGGPIRWQRITWACVGTAQSMEDAKARGFFAPVLEWAGEKPLRVVDFDSKSAVSRD